MVQRKRVVIDGNEAAAHVAFKTSEVIAIYPITPSSNMGEWADAWAAAGHKNIWGTTPLVQEMQSEGGAAGAVHGSLQTGALSTTFTASQGLLLMVPNMYKIAGEMTSTVFHIAARAIAAQGLSIFGDHQDVMSTRATGWAMLNSASVQEALDMALVAHASTLEARIPFLHFFDGFRTSHEELKIEMFDDSDIRAMIDDKLVTAHRQRGLTPENPVMRGTAQNPDVYFQGRETVNPFYKATPAIVQNAMDKLAGIVGRQYHLFDYYGAPDADRVIVAIGSACGAIEETIDALNKQGQKVGLVKVRLYRPWSSEHLLAAIPATAKTIAVLDRTKEPGSNGEPLYLDVIASITEAVMTGKLANLPKVIGGRYGLGSKEFTPAMVKGIYDEMAKAQPLHNFVVGIVDDVNNNSIAYDADFSTEPADVVRAMFWGLGADGTVGANKNSIKIIGEETDFYAQGYYVYDSKKSGSLTVSHLRFGPRPIKSTYLIDKANFVACHQFVFMEKFPVLDTAAQGATFLLNAPYSKDEVWNQLPKAVQETIIKKQIKLYVIDAASVAKATGMFPRINTIMQTCFFAISNVLPKDEAIAKIKESIRKTYSKRGEAVVQKNFAAVDETLANLFQVAVPAKATSTIELPPVVSAKAPEFVQKITAEMMANRGNELPVSAMPVDGTFPTGTTQWEKRNIAADVPVWETDLCIECGKCVMVCPHAVIRAKIASAEELAGAPEGFKSMDAKWKEHADQKFVLGFAIEDCTGCGICVEVCPAKDKTNTSRKAINMQPQLPIREEGRKNWDFFLTLPQLDRSSMAWNNVKNSQLLEPLFEFSGACAGCGETPYVKLVSQLFGDRMIVANATGCSSIYGGNLPTTPWTKNADGRGPAWSNSLFEDNAEFGLGMRLAVDKQTGYASELVDTLKDQIGAQLAEALLSNEQKDESEIAKQRQLVAELKAKLAGLDTPKAKDLLAVADYLVKKSVWIMGGDGWAYDIGYGGLDHVIASGANVNILVLDTEVYSNTGGQASKSTPRGAVAKFAAGGKNLGKKNLGMIAMSYGNVYVAQIAMGANDAQTIKAIMEAEAYDGPSIIIAYSHCIAHGIDMAHGMDQQKLAVSSGHWPLYRFDPRLKEQGKNPLQLEYKGPQIPLKDYVYNETRYRMLVQSNPAAAEKLLAEAQVEVNERWENLKNKAGL